jgi:hypothetical protein
MSQPNIPEEDLLPEYDFSNAVRGKHFESYRAGTNVVFLDPDIARAFKDSAHVNRVLRMLLTLAKEAPDQTEPSVR